MKLRLDEADILVKRAEEVDRRLKALDADALFHAVFPPEKMLTPAGRG